MSRIDNPSSSGTPLTSHTADFNITTSGYHDNKGASGVIVGSFDDTPGIESIIVRIASFAIRILPPVGKQIIWSADDVMAIDEYLELSDDLDKITCIVNPDGNIVITGEIGNINEENA